MAGAAPQVQRNKGTMGSKDLHLENFSVSNGGQELIEVYYYWFQAASYGSRPMLLKNASATTPRKKLISKLRSILHESSGLLS